MPSGPDGLVVATYNVHACVGRDGRRDVERVARVIRELEADVVGLQEVVSCEEGDDAAAEQMDAIARAAGFHAVAGTTCARHGARFGNALLTRRPPREVRLIDLTTGTREPRCAIDADVDVGVTGCRAIVTHLGLSYSERRQQLAQLMLALAARPEPRLAVVLADLNLLRGPGELGPDMRASAERSFPAWWPLLALDRILVRPSVALASVAAHRSPLARVASDHLPVRGVLRRVH